MGRPLMGHGHGHGPAVGHAGARYRRRLAVSFALVLGFLVVELVVGLVSGSLAVLSDAGHMAADATALGAALVAGVVAVRADPTGRRTYGSYRAEVFASGLAVLLMLGVSAYVLVEAARRAGDPPEASSAALVVVGVVGLAVNVVVLLVLRRGSTESLAVRGAYAEVVADAAGSVGVLVAGLLVAATGQGWWDLVAAVAIGVFVAVRAVLLARDVLAVLGQHAPAGTDPAEVERDLRALDQVADVHDLHLWTLTSGMHVATAHLVVAAGGDTRAVLDSASALLRERHGVEPATVQVEPAGRHECDRIDW